MLGGFQPIQTEQKYNQHIFCKKLVLIPLEFVQAI